jgi:hypothetical protein
MNFSPIFTGQCISIHTITPQSESFCAEFSERERRDFEVAATILDTSIAIGRPPGGRAERLVGSRTGLWELRVTPPGRRGPHTRCLYICEGRALLLARGMRKAQSGIPRREIELADLAVLRWRERGDYEEFGNREARGSPGV